MRTFRSRSRIGRILAFLLVGIATWAGVPLTASAQVGGTVEIVASGASASEDGDVGIFTVTRTGTTNGTLAVNYAISGSATNGVDYVTIPASVTIPTGSTFARVFIRVTPDVQMETNKTVVLKISANANYVVGTKESAFVTVYDHSTFDRTKRFERGTGTDPTYHSFVIPLSDQRGVAHSAIGGIATNLFPTNFWSTQYHYNATNSGPQTNGSLRLAFQNPLASFGSRVGGSPLFVGRRYQFGAYAGIFDTDAANQVSIVAYSRTNFAQVTNYTVRVPRWEFDPADVWQQFATNGYSLTVSNFGLTTTISRLSGPRWGAALEQSYLYTHTAELSATNYIFEIRAFGYTDSAYPGTVDAWLAIADNGTVARSRLYTLEFDPVPPWRATFLDQPQFDGVPLPSFYQGKSQEELLAMTPAMPGLSNLVAANYQQLNHSSELRSHPALNQLVADLGNDPLALASYVFNEIDVTDLIDYDTNRNATAAVYVGGVNRSALATLQERQGSPLELCALTVYLLRQAGVPAVYVFPTNNGMQLLDYQLSRLMRMQLKGAVTEPGLTNMPHLIPVNYPWVAAYITSESRWVHFFPWLKDREIIEGFNLYDYLPASYNSGYKWLVKYLEKDANILGLSSESDLPSVLFPKFVQKTLTDNFPGLSLDDIGIQTRNRRRQFARWDDLPCPFALNGAPATMESLKTNTNLFNSIQIRVFSNANTNKFVDTGEFLVADLHNRKLLLRFDQVGTNNLHNMVLSLAPYHPGLTNKGVFTPGTDPTFKLTITNQLNSSDDKLTYRVTYRRLRHLGTNFVAASSSTNFWSYLYGQLGQQTLGQRYVKDELPFRKGDLIAFCLDAGRVSDQMLRVHAQELWDFERTAASTAATNRDAEVYLGTSAHLMGMSYWHNYDRFAAWNQDLHKVQTVGNFSYGFALLRPKRDSAGLLVTNGVVVPNQAVLHIPLFGRANIFNGSARPDRELDQETASWDFHLVQVAQASALEHGTIKSYFQTNAVSAVKLLHRAGPTNMLRLNAGNFLGYRTTIESADTNLWRTISNWFTTGGIGPNASPDLYRITNFCQGFVTPGNVTNGTFKGVGALLFQPYGSGGIISGGLDVLDGEVLEGGAGEPFPDWALTPQNSPEYSLIPNPAGADSSYSLLLGQGVNQGNQLPPSTTIWDRPDDYGSLLGGSVVADPAFGLAGSMLGNMFGTLGTVPNGYLSIYDTGAAGTSPVTYNDWGNLIGDPVNTMNGEFYIDAVDLSLPGPMPLQVRRNYGSQNLADNQFGFGWKLNCVPFLSFSASNSQIFAAEMDGSLLAYRKQAAPNDNLWIPTAQDNPLLNNKSSAGIGSVANLFNNRVVLTTSGGTNIYTLTGGDGSVRRFTQRSYPIGSFTRTRPYLDGWQDNRGNSHTFQYGEDATQVDYGQLRRIQSSNGSFLGFYYDAYGHIVEAYTGDGRRLYYDYDAYGDLVGVTLPDASELNYEYQHSTFVTNGVTNVYSTHLIVREFKPDGRVLQNDYDLLRRVTNQWATVGPDLRLLRNARFAYANNFDLVTGTNLLTGKTEIYDYTNRLTTYFYTNSLIRKIIDPLNQTNLQDWYETDTAGGYRRSLKSTTDKRGLTATFFYDARGNVVTNTVSGNDLTGDGQTSAVSTFTYNTNNLPLSATDPGGRQSVTRYGNTNFPFLPTAIETSASNGVAIATNLLLYTNMSSSVTNGSLVQARQSFGLLWRSVRAAGSADTATNEFTYDGRGFLTGTLRPTGTEDPAVINALLYNARDELVQQTDAAGRFTRFDYDGMGRLKAREVFEAGATVPLGWEYSYYNPNGELVWSDGPRYDPEDYSWRDYDGAGRLCVNIRWRSQSKVDGTGVEAARGDALYTTTFYDYDPLGNQIRMVDPRGVITTNEFDAIGQLRRRRVLDTNGAWLTTNSFAYEPGGQVSYFTNALGGVTDTKYTATGKPKSRRNADGSTNAWTYYVDGRPRREIQHNGAYWENTYDDANRRVTRIFYSAANAPLATNVVESDRRGNVIRSIDAGSFVSTNFYDGLDRIKVAAGPATISIVPTNVPLLPGMSASNIVQQKSTFTYDASGKVLAVVNALGDQSITTRDALGRVVRSEIRNTNNATARLTVTAYAANHHSVTMTNGSGSTAIASTTYSDNDGNPVLSLGYPAANVSEFVWQAYNVAGNRVASQQVSRTNSQAIVWATNGWTYDGLNRVRTATSRDGAATTNSHDAAGNVTNRAVPGGIVWRAAYNNASQMLIEYDSGTGLSAHTNIYAYYPSNSPYAGLLESNIDGRGVICLHGYDAWLRTATNTWSGPLAEHNLSTILHYDARGLATNIMESFANAGTGTATRLLRRHDAYGLLESETILTNEVEFTKTDQSWDSAGRRTSVDVVGFGAGTGTDRSFGFSYGWRADGLLAASQGKTGGGSYTYDSAGQLLSRLVGDRATTIDSRDGRGRPLSISTTIDGGSTLGESLGYTGDGLLAAHTVTHPDFTDSRAYAYASLSRRLTEERLNLNASARWTNAFAYDQGAASGPGVLTRAGPLSTNLATWSGGADGLSRIVSETNTALRHPAQGRMNASNSTASVRLLLDGQPQAVTTLATTNAQWPTEWRASVELSPGAHQLAAEARQSSGFFTTNTIYWVTNKLAGVTAADTMDAGGYLTQRVWKNPNGTTNRTQTYAWDGRGRLVKVVERDGAQSGQDWSAIYDASGRRLNTATIAVTNGNVLAAQARFISQFYDPQVKYLALGVRVDGKTTWKLHGPDTDGRYGGRQGRGGFDAIVPGPELFCPTLNDARGNVLAVYDQTHGRLNWNAARPTAYGAASGHRPPPLGHGADLIQSSAMAGIFADSTGLYWRGRRYYDPVAGRWLSPDPLGHASDPSLFTYANGDPINWDDPEGLLATQYLQNQFAGSVGMAQGVSDFALDMAPLLYQLTSPMHGLGLDPLGQYINSGADQLQGMLGDQFNRVTDNFSPQQGVSYAAGGFLGEVGPNFIPIAGLEQGAAGLLSRAEAALISRFPVLGESIGALAGRAVGWLDGLLPGANNTTPLYRAVMNSELDDIGRIRAFRNPAGIENKYFSTTAEGAASYGSQAYGKFGDTSPYTIIMTDAPTSIVPRVIPVDGGVPSVVIPTYSLPQLSTPQILPFSPVPR